MSESTVRFAYHTESIRSTALAIVVLFILAVLIPIWLLRLLLLAMASGPMGWIIFQWLRYGCGISVDSEQVIIQNSLPRRTRQIPYLSIRGHVATGHGGFAILYQQPRVEPPPENTSPVALSRARPESYDIPRHRLIVTPKVDGVEQLVAAVTAELARLQHTEKFSGDEIRTLVRRIRVRNIILITLLVLATPIYAIIISRLIGSFR